MISMVIISVLSKLKGYFRSVLRKIKAKLPSCLYLLRYPIAFIIPYSFIVYLRNILKLSSGKYALDMRKVLQANLLKMNRKTSISALNIFHGLYSTIQPNFLQQGLKRLGVNSRIETIDYNPGYSPPDVIRNNLVHPDFYYEHVKFNGKSLNVIEQSLTPRDSVVTDDYNLSVLYQYFLESWAKYDVFHFNWFLSFLPDNIDVEFIKKSGRKVYFHFRGCFILAKIVPEFSEHGQSVVDACMHCKKMGWREQYFSRFHRAVKFSDRVFVSTPNLCHCSPNFEYMPLSLDPDLEKLLPHSQNNNNVNNTITVLHAPSGSSIKRYEKGTNFVIKAINELRKEGLDVDLKIIENMSRAEAIKLYGCGDIFIEQLNLGSYGNTAIEAMAYGIPVLSCNHSSHSHLTPNCPIVDVDPTNLIDKLRDLIVSPDERKKVGKQCYDFARNFHGSQVVAEHLLSIYQEDLGERKKRPPNTLSNLNPNYSPIKSVSENNSYGTDYE